MESFKLIDTHAHLDFPELFHRIDQILFDAKKNNVYEIVTISTNLDKINTIKNISFQFDDIFHSVGVHPNETHKDKNYNNYNFILKLAKDKKCVAIGEAGLDYHFTMDFINIQKESFVTQINVARDLNLPIVIHARDADKDLIEILKSEYKNGPFKGILHCFSSSKELAYCGLDLDFFISFSGIVTFKSAKQVQEIASNISKDKMLIETDSPYLSPTPYRGSINEPKNCLHTLEFIAKLRKESFLNLAHHTYNNSIKIFDKIVKWKHL